MSELKAHEFCESDEFFREYPGQLSNEMHPYYLKSEADEVIAELKSQKAQAEDDCAYWKMNEGNAVNAMHETEEYAMQLYNEVLHQKYKRCVDKAKLCKRFYEELYYSPHYMPEFDAQLLKHYSKWHKLWLELAEKFRCNKRSIRLRRPMLRMYKRNKRTYMEIQKRG